MQRHAQLMQTYLNNYKPPKSSLESKTDADVLKEHHKFIMDDVDESKWEVRLAKRYHDLLVKTYALINLSRYKTGQYGLRWRSLQEMIAGKGQFICGSLDCQATENLETWEVLFAYMEDGEKKKTMVKVRTCPKCTVKLHWKQKSKDERGRGQKLEKKREKSRDEREKSPSRQTKDETKDDTDDPFHDLLL